MQFKTDGNTLRIYKDTGLNINFKSLFNIKSITIYEIPTVLIFHNTSTSYLHKSHKSFRYTLDENLVFRFSNYTTLL